MTTTTVFQLFEEKKHSVRYNAVKQGDEEPNMISVYINKAALPRPFPSTVKVTVEA